MSSWYPMIGNPRITGFPRSAGLCAVSLSPRVTGSAQPLSGFRSSDILRRRTLCPPAELQNTHDDAFDVERVTKEFYTLIAVSFSALVGGKREVKVVKSIRKLNLRDKLFDISWWEQSGSIEPKGKLILPLDVGHKEKQEFAVRLLGRLVFCWFLKKRNRKMEFP